MRFKWSLKKKKLCVAKYLLAIQKTFLYENDGNYNYNIVGDKFTSFTLFTLIKAKNSNPIFLFLFIAIYALLQPLKNSVVDYKKKDFYMLLLLVL